MEFAIEVPGEAAPLTPQQVYLALQSASSSQQASIQSGTKQLQTWETKRGYHQLLQAVYLDKSLPSEIRYLAIIQLKNGIDKYWRKTAPNVIAPQEKAEIRLQLLEGGISEAETPLALQNALVVAKVVRIDYPLDWPDVLTGLIKILRNANRTNQLHLRRGLLILLQVVKELSTARLRLSQTSLQSVTPEIVFLLNEIYQQKVAQWLDFLGGNGDDEGGAMDAMENSLFAIKILRRLLIAGYEYPNHSKDVALLWEHSQLQFGQFLQMISQDPPVLVSPAKELVEKHLLQFSKLHLRMSTDHPAAFALLPASTDLIKAYWGLVSKFGDSWSSDDFNAKIKNQDHDKDERPVMEKLCLKGLSILRACMKMVFSPAQSFKYKTPEIKAEQKEAVALIRTDVLTDELVPHMANVIVTKFFVFRQADLEAWEADEDDWETREEGSGNTWEFEVRPCAEKLFMDLVIHFKDLLVEPLLSFFQSVTGIGQSSVVMKDAVYTAMGLSAPVIFERFDFDAFLTSTLVNDVQQTGPGSKVLRRRIAILIGQWITVKVSVENRSLVYQIFQHLLKTEDETNDYVVRVTAARQLKTVLDDVSFEHERFLPYSADILSRLMALIQEVENTETKLAILETIRIIAVRLEHHITPYSDQIVSLLPGLWEASGEEHLMKQAILTLFSTLVIAMKEQSQRYHPMILPLIQRAVEPGSEMQIYLMDEALDLWSTILSQTLEPASPELLALVDSAFPLLEHGSENLRTVLNIMESYVLLAPESMLDDAHRVRILSSMTSLLGVSKRELVGLVANIVENMIRAAESLGGTNGVTLIANDIHECGFSEKIFKGLCDAWEAHESSGPTRRYPKLDGVVETDYFTILGRISLAEPSVFVTLMGSIGSVDEVWAWLSTEWFRQFDSMANIEHQKLSCLALTRLLELPPPLTQIILTRLQDFFAMWTSVIGEMIAGRDDDGDNLIWFMNEGGEFEGPEDVRKRLLAGEDPVHRVHTFEFVKEHLRGLMQAVGGEEEFQRSWALNVDKDVLAGFRELDVKKDIY